MTGSSATASARRRGPNGNTVLLREGTEDCYLIILSIHMLKLEISGCDKPLAEQEPPCRMDLPGPITSVGTRTDYSVGPWDYSTWAV
jgi:hypothetical protein